MAESGDEIVVEFRNVTKAFGESKVLDDLSFEVRKGEILAVVGPSGTGKSVTLKHIVRLLEPDSGTVRVCGTDVSECDDDELEAVRRKVGYLFQSGALLAWKTVAENVAMPLQECTKLSEDEIDRRVAAALEAVELTDAAEKYPSEISGGMQKRAGLARAVVREAEIVLYDEPTSGLDPVTSVHINGLIKKLNRERGITSVVVTHDLALTLEIADRILLLKDGKAVIAATPEEFVKSDNEDVRRFLAAMKGKQA